VNYVFASGLSVKRSGTPDRTIIALPRHLSTDLAVPAR
jgi:hypothetical protein